MAALELPAHALPASARSRDLSTPGEAAAAPLAFDEQALPSHRRPGYSIEAILASAGEGIYGLDTEGRTTFVNPAAAAMTGWSPEDLVGNIQHAVLHHSYPDGTPYPCDLCPLYQAIRHGRVVTRDDEVFWRKNGTSFPVRYTGTPVMEDGVCVGAVVVFEDISERKRLEHWSRRQTAIFLAITGHRPAVESLTLLAQALTAYNASWAAALFVPTDGQLKLTAHSGLDPILQALFQAAPAGQRSVFSTAFASGKQVTIETAHRRARYPEAIPLARAGFTRACLLPLVSMAGNPLGVLALLARDSSLAGELEEPLNSACDLARLALEHQQLYTGFVHQLQFDRLTGLPNRVLFEDRLRQAVLQAHRTASGVAVCTLDLDFFQQLNEALGLEQADIVLQQVAARLTDALRDVDTVARPHGDVFLLLLPGLRSLVEAEEVAARILNRLRDPIETGTHTLALTASLGISLFPADATSAETLLLHAEAAMHTAKQAGRDTFKLFNPVLGKTLQRRAAIRTALNTALERDQLRLAYQGIYNPALDLVGFEALLRWNHPELGPIGPDEFIPLAEESGLIVRIGKWVLQQACRQMKTWQTLSDRELKIFVNVSAVQLSRPGFPATVQNVLKSTGLSPASLDLEITETWIMADPQAAALQLHELRALGIASAIDDFGTGHSSFSSLHHLPVHTIKIDRSFISRIDGTPNNSATVRTIIELAHQLGLRTVAEGIETVEQRDILQALHCDLFQGYLLARPLDPAAAQALIPLAV